MAEVEALGTESKVNDKREKQILRAQFGFFGLPVI